MRAGVVPAVRNGTASTPGALKVRLRSGEDECGCLRRLETALGRLRLDCAAAAAIAERDFQRRAARGERPHDARLHEIGARRIAVERVGVEAVRAARQDRLGGVERQGREMRIP